MSGAMYAKIQGEWEQVYPPLPGPFNYATGGNVTMYAASGKCYRVHKFLTAGQFNVIDNPQPFDYLLVAGGGGGGNGVNGISHEPGGGGAGGLLKGSMSLATGTQAVTIGTGGAAQNAGQNSTALGLTAIGGGRGATGGTGTGGNGGSGGGGAHDKTNGGTGTTGQGNAGEKPAAASRGGGGGGAGQAGGTNGVGRGGDGVQSDITGTPTYYAGGGAGYSGGATSGGLGGGGNTPASGNGTAGTDGLGGGGGGGYGATAVGGKGGSGVFIVRYEVAYMAPILVSAAPAFEKVTLTWEAFPGAPTAVSYEVRVGNDLPVDVGNVLTHEVTGLTNGQTYSFKVRAVTASGKSLWSNVMSGQPDAFNAATGGTETTIPNYNGSGETWRVHTFTGNGQFTVTAAPNPFRVLRVGGGGGGGGTNGSWGGNGGYGGQVVDGDVTLAAGQHAVTIGQGGAATAWQGGEAGGASSLGTHTANGGNGGPGNFEWTTDQPPGTTSTITGAAVLYGKSGTNNCVHNNRPSSPCTPYPLPNTGGGGHGSERGQNVTAASNSPGATGIVIIAYRIA